MIKNILPNVAKLNKLSSLKHSRFSGANLVVFATIFAAIGGYIIYSSFAAGFTTSFEAESTTKNSPATSVSDTNASGGSALKFQGAGSSSCPLPAFPSASCTGVPAGTQLTTVSGDLRVSTNNTIVDSKNVTGCILVEATGVTIKNSRAACVWANNTAAQTPANGPVTVQDSEINCGNVDGGGHFGTGVGPQNLSMLRVNIHGCENGASVDRNFILRDSYVHDLFHGPTTHTDGIETGSPSTNLTFDHNTIYAFNTGCAYPNSGTCNGTSALNILTDGTTVADVVISNNLMAGGAHTLYCPIPSTARMSITGNHFSTIYSPNVGEYDASQDCTGETWSGNVHHESGRTIIVDQLPPY
jgi:hypothetical protein